MNRPDVLMIGPYPHWDMEPLEGNYSQHKSWEATDKPAFVSVRSDKISRHRNAR